MIAGVCVPGPARALAASRPILELERALLCVCAHSPAWEGSVSEFVRTDHDRSFTPPTVTGTLGPQHEAKHRFYLRGDYIPSFLYK